VAGADRAPPARHVRWWQAHLHGPPARLTGGGKHTPDWPGSYCPQTVVLDEALTVDQNVRYFQAAYGIGGTGRAEELIVLRLRMPRPARVAAPSGGAPAVGTHHQLPKAAVAQTSGGPGRNPGESGLTADQRVVPPPAARAR
jgi:hypothetical protein